MSTLAICGSRKRYFEKVNKVVYLVAFGDLTWKLGKPNFVVPVGQCSLTCI